MLKENIVNIDEYYCFYNDNYSNYQPAYLVTLLHYFIIETTNVLREQEEFEKKDTGEALKELIAVFLEHGASPNNTIKCWDAEVKCYAPASLADIYRDREDENAAIPGILGENLEFLEKLEFIQKGLKNQTLSRLQLGKLLENTSCELEERKKFLQEQVESLIPEEGHILNNLLAPHNRLKTLNDYLKPEIFEISFDKQEERTAQSLPIYFNEVIDFYINEVKENKLFLGAKRNYDYIEEFIAEIKKFSTLGKPLDRDKCYLDAYHNYLERTGFYQARQHFTEYQNLSKPAIKASNQSVNSAILKQEETTISDEPSLTGWVERIKPAKLNKFKEEEYQNNNLPSIRAKIERS
ncbi:MAG: hypothetical protein ACK4M7_09120, partial [Burkholderiales bacterium]